MTQPETLVGGSSQQQRRQPARVAVIALAAGASRRFGHADKLLAPVEGVPLAVRILREISGVSVEGVTMELFAVVPDLCGGVAQALRSHTPSIALVPNPRHAEGMGTSLAAGIVALEAKSHPFVGAIITPCDLPGLTGGRIGQMVAAFLGAGCDRVVHLATADGTPVSPMVWPRCYFPRLSALGGDQGARRLVAGASTIAFPASAEELADIDTAEDLARYERSAAVKSGNRDTSGPDVA